jgi:hypothetical protein
MTDVFRVHKDHVDLFESLQDLVSAADVEVEEFYAPCRRFQAS